MDSRLVSFRGLVLADMAPVFKQDFFYKIDVVGRCDRLHGIIASLIKTKTHRGTAVCYSSWFSLILVKTHVAVLTHCLSVPPTCLSTFHPKIPLKRMSQIPTSQVSTLSPLPKCFKHFFSKIFFSWGILLFLF